AGQWVTPPNSRYYRPSIWVTGILVVMFALATFFAQRFDDGSGFLGIGLRFLAVAASAFGLSAILVPPILRVCQAAAKDAASVKRTIRDATEKRRRRREQAESRRREEALRPQREAAAARARVEEEARRNAEEEAR